MNAVQVVQRFVQVFEQLRIDYVTVGAFSVNVHGSPRLTKDADFVAQLGANSIDSIMAIVGTDFELERQMSFETITATMRYRLRHRQTRFVVELFLLSDDPHDRTRFERRVKGRVGDSEVWVLTAEDVIITKLRWSRHGKRSKDREDIVNVLTVQRNRLDLEYIRSWTDQHGTAELFDTLLQEAAEI